MGRKEKEFGKPPWIEKQGPRQLVPMMRVQSCLPYKSWLKIKEKASKENISFSACVRQILTNYIEKNRLNDH